MVTLFKRLFHGIRPAGMPPIWIIALVAGFPIFSETMYTPALPHIARSLAVPASWVEYTLSIYFFGTAFGVIFWGRLSDRLGRRPILMAGFAIYIVSCLMCFLANNITALLMARVLQSLGGSVGVVLGQTIAHDVFTGQKRGETFSAVGSILSLAPAAGPLIGGIIDQYYGWQPIFIALMIWGFLTACLVFYYLPETRDRSQRTTTPLKPLMTRMIRDRKVIVCALTVGLSNGLLFSYNAEGPFYLIDMLGLTPFWYGAGFAGLALTGALGSHLSRRMHNRRASPEILKIGQATMFLGTFIFLMGTLLFMNWSTSRWAYIVLTLTTMLIIALGRGLTVANSLSLGLEGYSHVAGTASSLFVFSYYTVIASITTLMGKLHNGTLIPMPTYFFVLGILLLIARTFVPTHSAKTKKN